MCNCALTRFQGLKKESVGQIPMRLDRLEALHLPNSKGFYLHTVKIHNESWLATGVLCQLHILRMSDIERHKKC